MSVQDGDGTRWRQIDGVDSSRMAVDLFVSIDLVGKLEDWRVGGSISRIEAKLTSHFDVFVPYPTMSNGLA
jgi:hypothetical protein